MIGDLPKDKLMQKEGERSYNIMRPALSVLVRREMEFPGLKISYSFIL